MQNLEHGLSFVLNLDAACPTGTYRRHSWPRGVHGIISSLALAKKCQISKRLYRIRKTYLLSSRNSATPDNGYAWYCSSVSLIQWSRSAIPDDPRTGVARFLEDSRHVLPILYNPLNRSGVHNIAL